MNNFHELIKNTKPTLVDFFATWCGPCKMQSPIIEQVRQRMGNDANVLKIDVDRYSDISALYHVKSVPTLIIFKEGEIVWRASGLHQEDVLVAKLCEFIPPQKDK